MTNNPWPWPKSPASPFEWLSSLWPFNTITNTSAQNTVDLDCELLPCPFCGSTSVAHIIVPQYERPDLPDPSWVQCNDCGAEVHNDGIDRDRYKSVRDLWNTRT